MDKVTITKKHDVVALFNVKDSGLFAGFVVLFQVYRMSSESSKFAILSSKVFKRLST